MSPMRSSTAASRSISPYPFGFDAHRLTEGVFVRESGLPCVPSFEGTETRSGTAGTKDSTRVLSRGKPYFPDKCTDN